MTDNERILIHQIAEDITGEDMALCGSIQSYRMALRRKGTNLSFRKAAEEWKKNVYLPIISELKDDPAVSIAIGKNVNEAFFRALYATEVNGFIPEKNMIRAEAMKKAHGLRAFISRLIA